MFHQRLSLLSGTEHGLPKREESLPVPMHVRQQEIPEFLLRRSALMTLWRPDCLGTLAKVFMPCWAPGSDFGVVIFPTVVGDFRNQGL